MKLTKPDFFKNLAGQHLGATIGNVILKSYKILEEEKPDTLLIPGDINSVLSIAAKQLNDTELKIGLMNLTYTRQQIISK